jgi:hypothetical protein
MQDLTPFRTGGHIQPSILDTIAVPLEDEEDKESP